MVSCILLGVIDIGLKFYWSIFYLLWNLRIVCQNVNTLKGAPGVVKMSQVETCDFTRQNVKDFTLYQGSFGTAFLLWNPIRLVTTKMICFYFFFYCHNFVLWVMARKILEYVSQEDHHGGGHLFGNLKYYFHLRLI